MSKMKNFMEKPVTWGGYFKLAGWATLIGTIFAAIEVGYFLGWFTVAKEKLIELKKKLF